MTFDSIWLQLCEKNNLLIVEESIVEFRSKNLKTLLIQVYEQGKKVGESAKLPKSQTDSVNKNYNGLYNDFFGSIFGNKK